MRYIISWEMIDEKKKYTVVEAIDYGNTIAVFDTEKEAAEETNRLNSLNKE